ncbi:uncharacterized protein EI90DRAFT_3086172 [Cantharellus anzutake]|uniref:uncharacterized protein n=1 Tax=Cantharellus anzutake TaxID=1750568 RepID=UPI001906307D|nr:uncharacterized protein EI90DRAFT_3086172 [Cantharellus anzutake]KAF8316510.1 hypothetical protein EI90DRAFT_3086172 [Cantharellus anzutake]
MAHCPAPLPWALVAFFMLTTKGMGIREAWADSRLNAGNDIANCPIFELRCSPENSLITHKLGPRRHMLISDGHVTRSLGLYHKWRVWTGQPNTQGS